MVWTREKYGSSGEVSFSEEEWNKLLSVVEDFETDLLLKFTISTGLRREDVVNVLIENIDFNQNILTFYEKKKKRTRQIPIPEKVIKLIQKLLNVNKRRSGKLFNFSGRTAYNMLNRNCQKAGLGRRPFHALRATCAKFCAKAGWSTLEIAKLLGDTVEVIETHYAVPSMGDMKAAMNDKPII